MDLADHTQDEYQKVLYYLQKNLHDDKGARSYKNAQSHCDWIHQTFAPDGKTLNILDMGCGIGLYSIALAKKGHSVIGIDISPYVIEHAKQLLLPQFNCNFIKSNILDFKWPNQFDLVIFTYSIFNLLSNDDVKKFLNNVSSLLKVGGNFYFEPLQVTKEFVTSCSIGSTSKCASDPLYPGSKTIISDCQWDQITQTLNINRYYVINCDQVKKSTIKLYYYSYTQYRDLLREAGLDDIHFIPSPPGTLDNDQLPYMSVIAKRCDR